MIIEINSLRCYNCFRGWAHSRSTTWPWCPALTRSSKPPGQTSTWRSKRLEKWTASSPPVRQPRLGRSWKVNDRLERPIFPCRRSSADAGGQKRVSQRRGAGSPWSNVSLQIARLPPRVDHLTGIFHSSSRFSNVKADEFLNHAGSGSGGYLHHVFTYAAKQLFGEEVTKLTYRILKWVEQSQNTFTGKVIFINIITPPGTWLLLFSILTLLHSSATGTRTSRKWLWRKTELCCCVLHPRMVSATSRIWCKSSRGGSVLTTSWKSWLVPQVRRELLSALFWSDADLAPPDTWHPCGSGCLNGGGQLKALPGQDPKKLLQKVEEIYRAERSVLPEDDTRVAELYNSWLSSVGEERARELLHTHYHTVEKMTNGLAMKWWPHTCCHGWSADRIVVHIFCTDSRTVQLKEIVSSDWGFHSVPVRFSWLFYGQIILHSPGVLKLSHK